MGWGRRIGFAPLFTNAAVRDATCFAKAAIGGLPLPAHDLRVVALGQQDGPENVKDGLLLPAAEGAVHAAAVAEEVMPSWAYSSAGTTLSTYNAANRLTGTTGTGASTYTFDADGNTLTGGGRTNTWDSQNRLVSCTYGGTTSTFTYGADGLRRSSTVGGVTTYYVYDGQTLVREMQRNTQTNALYNTATYLTGPRGPEYRRDDTQTEMDSQGRTVSKTRWYVYDGLGSVVGEVDPNGSLTSSPKYDVYGLVRSNSGTASSKMGFVGSLGHLSEANTGLIYMRARYYDPSNGRFASEDPECHGANWYVYCHDDPVNCVDETGKMDKDIKDAINMASSGVFGVGVILTMVALLALQFKLGAAAVAMAGGAVAFFTLAFLGFTTTSSNPYVMGANGLGTLIGISGYLGGLKDFGDAITYMKASAALEEEAPLPSVKLIVGLTTAYGALCFGALIANDLE